MKLNVLIILLLVGLALSKVVRKDNKKKPKENEKVTAEPEATTSNPEDSTSNVDEDKLRKSQFDEPQKSEKEVILDHVKDIFEFWVSIIQHIIAPSSSKEGNIQKKLALMMQLPDEEEIIAPSSSEEGNVQKKLASMMQLPDEDDFDEEKYEGMLYIMILKDIESGGALTAFASQFIGKDGSIDEKGLEILSKQFAEQLVSNKEDINKITPMEKNGIFANLKDILENTIVKMIDIGKTVFDYVTFGAFKGPKAEEAQKKEEVKEKRKEENPIVDVKSDEKNKLGEKNWVWRNKIQSFFDDMLENGNVDLLEDKLERMWKEVQQEKEESLRNKMTEETTESF